MDINLKKKNELLSLMLRVRTAEEKVVEVYARDQQMRTPTHLSIGQEAVAAGVCCALQADDQVFAPHRSHAMYLAKGGNIDAFFAELCGRASGSNAGRGGSAHLADAQKYVYASPILGAMLPVAVGAALSFQMDQKKNVAVAVCGDATIEEGVFIESLNFAVIKKLPVVFICENNLYSTATHIRKRQPSSQIFERVKAFEPNAQQIDGNDIELVYSTAQKAIEKCRSGNGPAFIECLTYRIREHVGPLMDYDRGYRSKEEVDTWIKKCPVNRYQEKLLKEKVLMQKEYDALVKKYQDEMEVAYRKALSSPWPDAERLEEFVY